MRIALIIYGDLDQNSGGYLYDRYLVDHLRKQKHQIEIISLPWQNYASNLTDNFSKHLFLRVKEINPDLILEDELCHPSLISLNRKTKSETGTPIVSIVHHLRSSEPRSKLLNALYRNVERRYLAGVNGFVYNSFTTKKVVVDILGASKPNVVAQPGGNRLGPKISSARIRNRAKTPGPLRIVFLGNLIRRKAPHLLIEAAAQLPRGSVQIIFAGEESFEPSYSASLKKFASQYDMGGDVEFAGHLAQAKLVHLLLGSHVLAVPSSYEGYGIAYVEGMGFGLPAIGTRSGAATEIITDGRNGYLIDAGDVIALRERLEYLRSNRNVLEKMSLAALKQHGEHPTWQKSMLRVSDFLSSYNLRASREPSSRRKT